MTEDIAALARRALVLLRNGDGWSCNALHSSSETVFTGEMPAGMVTVMVETQRCMLGAIGCAAGLNVGIMDTATVWDLLPETMKDRLNAVIVEQYPDWVAELDREDLRLLPATFNDDHKWQDVERILEKVAAG